MRKWSPTLRTVASRSRVSSCKRDSVARGGQRRSPRPYSNGSTSIPSASVRRRWMPGSGCIAGAGRQAAAYDNRNGRSEAGLGGRPPIQTPPGPAGRLGPSPRLDRLFVAAGPLIFARRAARLDRCRGVMSFSDLDRQTSRFRTSALRGIAVSCEKSMISLPTARRRSRLTRRSSPCRVRGKSYPRAPTSSSNAVFRIPMPAMTWPMRACRTHHLTQRGAQASTPTWLASWTGWFAAGPTMSVVYWMSW